MVALGNIVNSLFNFYSILIIVWCFMSWFPIREGSLVYDIAMAINSLVSPYMNLFRRFIPPLGGIDFSPILAILVLNIVQGWIVRTLVLM